MIDDIQEVFQLWSVYADVAGVPAPEIDFIDKQLVTLT